ncbi:hypothetical protein AYO47_06095 [Planctomyces sp. SCGC AG-212-M04]|nr:hypothetical protein AYO47_06095 [Planctomyces sp. SCGC AG-212-M04]
MAPPSATEITSGRPANRDYGERRPSFKRGPPMFAFYSSRSGCLGSIVISVIGSVVLILLMRGCN